VIPLAVVTLALLAVDAPSNEFVHWGVSDIAAQGKAVAHAQKDGVGNGALHDFGNHTARITVRSADGKPELHEKKNDFFVVESGEATLLTGGTIVDDKSANGEHTGTSIQGAQKTRLRRGDVVHIPAGMPHQLLVAKGQTFTYFVIKVLTP
jgi:mannose-6-phosphate isomerase-like protein (cupin superfamily)